MANESERMQILAMIESGKITASQGLQLLEALQQGADAIEEPEQGEDKVETPPLVAAQAAEPHPAIETDPTQMTEQAAPQALSAASESEPLPETPASLEKTAAFDEQPSPATEEAAPAEITTETTNPEMPAVLSQEKAEQAAPDKSFIKPLESAVMPNTSTIARWRRWWMIPLWIGAGITVLGGLLMYLALVSTGFSFWFACSWMPFLFGVFVLALAWATRTMRWLHVRIQQQPGEWPRTIAISLPLPINLASWVLRTFKFQIPGMENNNLDEILAVLNNTSPEAPFFVEVNEAESGEHVEVYIG